MSFRRMTGSLKNRLVLVFAVLLVIGLSASAFAYSVTIQLNSNTNQFETRLVKCTDSTCSQSAGTGIHYASGASTSLQYPVTEPGSYVEFDYAPCKIPKVIINDFTGAETPGPHNYNIPFSVHKNRNATINSVTSSSQNVNENTEVTVTANINAALGYPSTRKPPIPTDLKDAYSYTTDVTFTVKDQNGNVVGSPLTKQTSPLIGSNENSEFKFTPKQQGTYKVEVKTKVNDCQADPVTATEKIAAPITISVGDTQPTADFSADKQTGTEPLTVKFTATVNGNDPPFKYKWDFGDGQILEDGDATPEHPYLYNGDYNVTLTVTDVDGTANPIVVTKQNFIQVGNSGKPTANFQANPVVGTEQLNVTFTDLSTGTGVKEWYWNFDDGTNPPPKTNKSPTHIFTQNGTYTVSLVVKDKDGDTSDPFTQIVVIDDSFPNVDFAFSPASPTEEQPIQFTSTIRSANDLPLIFFWDFGDGTNSTSQNPTKTYTTDGIKTVGRSIIDFDGSSVYLPPTQINVAAVNDAPKIQGIILIPVKQEDFSPFTLDMTPFEANADEEDSGTSLVWSVNITNPIVVTASVTDPFNNIVTFTPVPNASGSTQVTFTLTDSGGKTDTQILTFTVDPVNDQPSLNQNIPDQQWNEDTVKTINLLDYFSDVEGPLQSILPVSQPTNINVNILTNFTAVLTPDPNFNSVEGGGTRTVVFNGTDLGGLSKQSNQVTLTVNPVNEISSDSTISSTSNVNEFSTISGGSTISGNSNVVNSTVSSSTVQNSNLQNSSLSQGSVAQNSNLVNVVLINSTVIDTSLENVVLVNTFINPSNVKNSVIQDSRVINSNVTDSTIVGSTILNSAVTSSDVSYSRIENMTVTAPDISSDVLYQGTIVYLGETYTVTGPPPVGLNYIKDRSPVLSSTINPITWNEDTVDTSLNLNTKFSDPDNPTLNFTFTPNPVSNINIQINNGVATFTPTANFTGTRTVTFTATDNLGKFAITEVTLTVTPVNDNPVLVSPLTLTATEDSQYISALEVSDVDNTAFTFSLLVPPTGMSVNPSSGEITWTPTNSQVGPNLVSAKVDDGSGGTDVKNFTITVANTNDAPTTSTIQTQIWNEDTLSPVLNLSQFFSDVDVSDTLTFSVVQNPVNVVANLVGNLVTFTPSANFTGLNSVKFRATDTSGNFTDSNLVTLNVTPVNDPPVVTLLQPNGGELLNGVKQIKWNASDVDGDTLNIKILTTVDGLLFQILAENETNDGVFDWDTSLSSDSANHKIKIEAADGTVTVSDDDSNAVFSVDNTPPSVDIVGPLSLLESATPVFYNSTTSDNIAGVNPSSFVWTFGDGTNSTGSSTSHAYTQSGTFVLTLTVKDNLGNQGSSIKEVVVNDTSPVSNFTFTPSAGISEGTTQINFTSLSTAYDLPLTLVWTFGDGTNSTQTNPTKVYNSNGTYTVTLTATDSDSSISQSQQIVTVSDLGPVASFTSTPTSNIFENTTQVNFTDQSTSSPDTISSRSWNFGDGSPTSSLQNPVYTFAFNGTYTVTLTVTDSDGTQSTSFAQNVTVLDKSPTAEAGANQVVDEGNSAFFDGSVSTSSPDTIVEYFWNFGDGTNSTGVLANHTYVNNNTYTVTLTVTDSDGSQNSDTLQVTVNDKSPSVDFTFNPTNPDEDQTITFTDTSTSSTDSITSYLWSFGDSGTAATQNSTHSYIVGDAFQVTLTLTDSDGSTNSTTKTVNVNPINDAPEFNLSAALANVNFDEDTTGTVNLAPSFFDIDNSDLNWTFNSADLSNLSVNINQDTGLVTFTPDQNFAGTRQINFTATDSLLNSNQSNTITVTVNPVNDAPNSPTIPTQIWIEDNQQTLNLSQFFSDADNSTLVYSVVLSSANTTPVITGEIVTFTPAANFTGLNTVQFSASDGSLVNNSNIITLNVTPVNDAPEISQNIPNQTWPEDTTQQIDLSQFFSDVDNANLVFYSNREMPSPTEVIVFINGSMATISSSPDFNGLGNVTFTTSDGEFNISQTIFLNVTPVNDAPIMAFGPVPNVTWPEDTNITDWANPQPSFLTFFIMDIDGDNLTFTTIQNPVNVTVLINGSQVTYVPDPNFNGINTVQFRANDSNGGIFDSNIVFLNVTPVNDAPIVFSSVPDITFNEDSYNDSLQNLNNFFSDVDNSVLEFTAVSDNLNILVNITGSSVNITSAGNFSGQGNVTFTASDGELNTTDTILVNVISVNDEPTISNLSITGLNSSGLFRGILVLSTHGSDVEDGVVINIQFERSLNSTNGTDGTFVIIADPSMWPSEPVNETDQSVWIIAKAIDSQGGQSDYIRREIKIDNQPPATNHTYDNTWKTANFTIALIPEDFNGSGVTSDNIFYRINGGDLFNVLDNGQPVITQESGSNYIEFKSIDVLGNQEPWNNLTDIRLDKTKPVISSPVQTPTDVTEDTLTSVEVNTTVSDATSGLEAGYPKLYYKLTSWENYTTINMTPVLGIFTSTIPIELPSWDYYRSEVLTYRIIARDVAGNERITEANETIDNINDIPIINLTGILPSPSSATGNFSPNSLTEIIAAVADDGDLNGSTAPAGRIVNVTFEVSMSGENGTFLPCSGSLVSSNATAWRHQCNNILAESQQSEDIWLKVRAQDNSGIFSNNSTLKIKIDNSAPTTTDNIQPAWINTTFSVTLIPSDINGSGVDFTRYCKSLTDGCTPTTTYLAPFGITQEGIWYVKYYSVDKLGKPESTKSSTLRIDKTNPVIITIDPADNYVRNNTEILVTVNTTDSLSGVSSVTVQGTNLIDQGNGVWEDLVTLNFDGPLPAVNVPLVVVVTDLAGNVKTNDSIVFHIDNDPPVINSVVLSDNVTQNNTPVTVTVNITEFGTLVEGNVMAEGVALQSQGSGIFIGTITLLAGQSPVDVFVVDEADNNATHNSTTFIVDDTIPETNDTAPASWQTSPFNITLTAIDEQSGIANITYSVDGVQNTTYSNTTNIEILTDGNHTIVYNATNNADGVSLTKTISALLDTVKPAVNFTENPSNDSVVGGWINYSLSAADTTSGIFNITIHLNSSELANYDYSNSPIGYSQVITGSHNSVFDQDGTYTLNATVVDWAGNQNTTTPIIFTIDNTKPQIFFNSPLEGPYNTDKTVNITISDAHPGTISLNVTTVDIAGTITSIVNTTNGTELIYVLGEGNHTVYATSTDTVGNTNQTQPRNILIDKSPPLVLSPLTLNVTYPENVTISVSVIDLVGMDKDFVNISGTLYSMGLVVGTTQNGGLEAIISGLAAGSYTAQFLVNDTLGNLNNSITTDFVVSKAESFVGLSLYGLTYENLTTEVFSEINSTGEIFYGEGDIQLLLNGSLLNSGRPFINNITNMTVLGPQNFTLVYPETQNFTRSNQTFFVNVVDTTSPVVTLVSPANNTLNNITASQNFQFTATDNFYPNLVCTLFVNGISRGENLSVSSGQSTTIPSTVPEGNNSWYVTCTDGSSNVGQSETRLLRTDYTPPSLTTSSINGGNPAGIFSPVNLGGPYTLLTIIANFSEPVRGKTGSPYSTHVYASNGTIVRNFAGPSTYSLSNIESDWDLFEINDDGTYTINTTVNDTAGNVATLFVGTFKVDNTPPSFLLESTPIVEGEESLFNGTNGDQNEIAGEDNSSFVWDFGDGTPVQNGMVVNHTYVQNGTYTFRLNITDLVGNVGTNTTNITVLDTSPTANFTFVPLIEILENLTEVNFTLTSTGYDLPLDYNWLWGDNFATSSSIQEATHIFAANNTYTVNLTVIDVDGSSYSTLQQIVVEDMKPTSDIFGSTQIFEGENATFNASGSTTVADPIVAYQWTISHNDGASFDLLNVTTSPTLTKQFNSNGTFLIGVLAIDSDDSPPFPPFGDLLNLTILDKSPVAVLTGDTVVFENQTAHFNASGSTSSPDTIVNYQWDFNYNGTFSPSGVTGPLANFTYLSPSTPTAAVKVTDSDGSTNTTTLQLLIKPSDHDVAVDTAAYNKSSSTVYLFDIVNVTANVSNLGNFDENVTIKLKEGATVLATKTDVIQKNKTKEVSFDWNATTAGFHNLIVEVLPVTSETNAVNNQKTLQNIQVFSVKDNVGLSFVNPSLYPNSAESANSQFYVWVRVANNLTTDLKDFPVTLNSNGLTINTTQDGNQNTVKVFNPLSGTRTFWWLLNAGSASTKDMTITIGNSGDSVTINRTVSVV